MWPKLPVSLASLGTLSTARRLIKQGGLEAFKRQETENLYHGNRTDLNTAETDIQFSLDNPHMGQVQVANQLKKLYKIDLSASGVRNIWLSEGMQTMALRLEKIQALSK